MPVALLPRPGRLGRPRPRHPPRRRRRDDLHQPVLPVPQPPPAENPGHGLAAADGTRRHPARHHPLRGHEVNPTLGDAPTTTTGTTTGPRPTTVLVMSASTTM